MKVALRFAIISGGAFALILFFGAGVIEHTIYPEYSGVQIPLRVLAPTIFIVALLGVFRGFFQGKRTMIPTAVSQIIEQVVNAIVSVAASYLFMKWNADSLQQAAWGAAGGTLGTCLGAASALLLVMFVYWLYRPVQAKLEKKDVTGNLESYQSLFKILILTILPIVLSQTVYNISGLIDYKLFGFISAKRGLDAVSIKSFVGVYSSKYRLLCSVPIAISTAIASSMIPSAVAAYTEGDDEQWNYNVASGIKFNMIIAIPCALGLTVLGQPVVRMLFSSSNYVLGGHMMTVGATAIIFYALSNVTGGALQSIDKMRIPVIHSAISLVIHIGIVSFFLACTNIGVYALLIGNITFPILVFILNLRAIKRYVPSYRQEVIKTFFAPLAAGQTRYSVVRKADGRVIGVISLMDAERAVPGWELGIEMAPDVRRQGYAREALAAVIQAFFKKTDTVLFTGGHYAYNTISGELLKMLGFTYEGIEHKAMRHAERGPTDLVCYYLEK